MGRRLPLALPAAAWFCGNRTVLYRPESICWSSACCIVLLGLVLLLWVLARQGHGLAQWRFAGLIEQRRPILKALEAGFTGMLALCLVALAGHQAQQCLPALVAEEPGPGWYRVRVLEAPTPHGAYRLRSPVSVQARFGTHAQHRLMAYWPRLAAQDEGFEARIGMEAIAYLVPEAPRPTQGPWDFDMTAWYHSKGVLAQVDLLPETCLLEPQAWQPIVTSNWWAIRRALEALRTKAVARCMAYRTASRMSPPGAREAWALEAPLVPQEATGLDQGQKTAVLVAMSLGWKQDLSTETRAVFADAGTMHVLAVSGLHVGLLALWLERVLFGLGWGLRQCRTLWRRSMLSRRREHGRVHWDPRFSRSQNVRPRALPLERLIQSMLLILGIWTYACFTGASPSVLRAAVFFSFWRGAKMLGRPGSAGNAWCAALLVLLWCAPWTPDAVGAQLSFAAVAGILHWHAPLRRHLRLRGRLGSLIGDLFAVSIAAQAGTWAIAWATFGHFPPWFLVGNLFAIPMAFMAIPGTALLLAFGDVPVLGKVLVWLLDQLLDGWWWGSLRMEQLPQWSQRQLPTALILPAMGCTWLLGMPMKSASIKAMLVSGLLVVLVWQQKGLDQRLTGSWVEWQHYAEPRAVLRFGRHVLPIGVAVEAPDGEALALLPFPAPVAERPAWLQQEQAAPPALRFEGLERPHRLGIPAWSWYIPLCSSSSFAHYVHDSWTVDSRRPGG
jgi:ComEC/Rec2-related protein